MGKSKSGGGSSKSSHGHGKQQDKFTHPWLLTSLKGHSGQVLDLDFSENGS